MDPTQLDRVAIRFDPLGEELVGSKLGNLHPIVCRVQQGLTGAHLPAADIGDSQPVAHKPTALHQIKRVIFVIDRSTSMENTLHPATSERKREYIEQRLGKLTGEYFQPGTEISLIQFNRSEIHEDCGTVQEGAIARLNSALAKNWSGTGTYFNNPLKRALEILNEDRRIENRERPETCETGIRSLVFFLTDGCDKRTDDVESTLHQIRDANALTFICGIGEQYHMSRITELATHAGAATWAHLPLRREASDGFEEQLSGILRELQSQEHYIKIRASGDYTRLTALTPAIRDAVPGTGTLFSGYSGESAGLLFEKKGARELTLSVEAGLHVGDLSGVIQEIPILDQRDAAAYFDDVQQALGHLDAFLIFRALKNRDLGLLKAMVERNSNLEPVLGPAIEDMEQCMPQGEYATHNIHNAMSQTGNPKLRASQWRLETQRADEGRTLHLQNLRESLRDNLEQDAALFSGGLGPLHAPPKADYPKDPINPDPRVYDAMRPDFGPVPTMKIPRAITVTIDGERYSSELALDGLLESKEYIFGRASEKPEDPDNWVRVIISGDRESAVISRAHFKIFSKDGRFFIQDLGSHNGTFLNGSKARLPSGINTELSDGDKIDVRVGDNFVFFAPKARHDGRKE